MNGTCATAITSGTACPANSTCIYEELPQVDEGQTCDVSCAGSSTITVITDDYANNCHPTACPGPLSGCASSSSCAVILDNIACGGDPCLGTAKGWAVTITCN